MTTDNLPPLPDTDDVLSVIFAAARYEMPSTKARPALEEFAREYGRACAQAALSTAPVQRVSPEDADLWRRMGQCAVELLPSILRGIADDLRQGLNTDSPKFRHIFAATIDQAAAALAAAPHTAAPAVAWRVRGYAQFKTGKPGPWRYFDGPTTPAANTPDCCDIEPLCAAAPVVQAVVPPGWKLMPPKLTGEMRVALVAAARRYMRDYGGNSPEAMYEAAFAAAPASDADSMPAQPTKEV